ncbi:methionyl-tRNA formyltransferase [Eionea flava]
MSLPSSYPSLNIIFAGTPHFAAHHLQALLDSHHKVVAVYTQPDRPAGRGKKLTPSPVKSLALDHAIPVQQPPSLKGADAQTALSDYQADVMVVVAYGLLLPDVVLKTPRFGCLNVHGSLLPRWRGAAPIQRAIESGDAETGITIMQMDKGLDTGDMLHKSACVIEEGETSASLHDKLMDLGAPALLHVLAQLPLDKLEPEQQNNDLASYAEKITKQEAAINWDEPSDTILRKVCAFNPFPVAYSFLDGERIKIYQAKSITLAAAANTHHMHGEIIRVDEQGLIVQCGEGSLCIKTLQMPNKKAMPIADLLNGHADRFAVGKLFSAQ